MSTSTTQKPTTRRIVGMVVGIVIIGLGIALFKQSHLGNDSISALNMRLAELLGISLGVQNICTNLVFLVVEFIWGRKYIGLGTLVNGLGCGFIITFFYDIIAGWFGPAEQLPIQLLWVVIAVPVTAFGCSLYQTADLGVAPYDSLALALQDHLHKPYFGCRVFTDALCAASPSCWAAWSASAPWSAPSALDLSSNSSMARSLRRFCNINLWKLLDLFLRGATH